MALAKIQNRQSAVSTANFLIDATVKAINNRGQIAIAMLAGVASLVRAAPCSASVWVRASSRLSSSSHCLSTAWSWSSPLEEQD